MKRCDYPSERLADVADGRADAALQADVRTHASQCASCAATLARLEALQTGFVALRDAAPDTAALARARDLFRERFQKPVRQGLLARLFSDSRGSLAPAGARGAAHDFQLVYDAGAVQITLWQERDESGRWYLIGQARSDDQAHSPEGAWLVRGDGETTPADVEGTEFHLPDLAPGAYDLRLWLDGVEVTLSDVPVGA